MPAEEALAQEGKASCQFCGEAKDARGLKAHERACPKRPSAAPEPKPPEAVVETVHVLLLPAYEPAKRYCKEKGFTYGAKRKVRMPGRREPETRETVRSQVEADIPVKDFEMLRKEHPNCVRRVR